MKKPNKIVLFDIDYTLFDQDSYRERFFPLLAAEIGIDDKEEFLRIKKAADEKTREIAGFFDPYVFFDELLKHAKKPVDKKRLEEVFFKNTIYESSLYEDAVTVLDQLNDKEKYTVGILSTGHKMHQEKKIEKIKKYFNKIHVHIFPNKITVLRDVLEKYKHHSEIYLIDDMSEVLKAAKEINKNLTTIWLKKTKKYEPPVLTDNFTPDYTFTNLSAILSILR